MSRSHHTEKESVVAKRNLEREACGCCVVLPRIIQRKPAPGDIHPVDKKGLAGILRTIPEEYDYGLDRIELKPREAPKSEEGYTLIGAPFGFYLPIDKSITLYSLPMKWVLEKIGLGLEASVFVTGARVEREKGRVIVTWPTEKHLGFWFIRNVVHHEIGHHYRHQYRRKRKAAYWTEEELVAELHAGRLTSAMFKDMRKRRLKREEIEKGGKE